MSLNRHHFLKVSALFLILCLTITRALPDQWWLNTEGISIKSNSQFKELVTGDDAKLADKHIFIDFYMQNCYWCYDFQSEWNQIVEDIQEMYGADAVEFLKVDGTNLYDISHKYSVSSYPTFIYVQPNTKGMKAVMFRGNRSYEGMKSWMERLLKDVPQVANSKSVGTQVGEEYADTQYDQGNSYR